MIRLARNSLVSLGALCKVFALSVVLALALGSAAFAQVVPTLSIDDVTITEGDTGTTNATFTATRSGNTTLISTVRFATADDTATQPGDYASTSGTLTFNAGETTKTVTASVNGDTVDELDEKFFVNLSDPVNATISDARGVGTITDDDDTPQANDDGSTANSITLNEDDPNGVTTNVMANDAGLGDAPITVEVTTSLGKGTATVNPDNTITYKPSSNQNGSDTYIYEVTDSDGQTSTATVHLLIGPVNDAPSFTKGANQSVQEDAGTQSVADWATSISAGPSDEESAQTVDFVVTNNNNGLFSVQPDVSSDGTLSYTPAANANGTASVQVIVRDNGGTANGGDDESSAQSFTITVNAVNDAPTVAGQSVTTNEDTTKTITLTSSDVDGDAQSFDITSASTSGTLGDIGTVACAGTAPKNCSAEVAYTPNNNYNGSDSFKFRVNDGTVNSTEVTIPVTVDAVNDKPEIDLNGGAASGSGYPTTFVEDGGPASIVDSGVLSVADVDSANMESATAKITNLKNGADEVLAADTTGTSVTATYDQASGELRLTGAVSKEDYQKVLRTVTYNNASQNPDTTDRSITFVVSDGTENSNPATSTVSMLAINDEPTVTQEGDGTVNEGETKTYNFTITDPDSGGFAVKDGFPDCGTGGALIEASLETTQNGGTFRCNFPEGPAAPTVKVKVEDSDGAPSNEATREVRVDNVAPSATFNVPGSVGEGDDINASMMDPSDPSSADAQADFEYAFKCGDADYDLFGASNTATCPSAEEGTVTVKGKILDKDGGIREYEDTVTVNNVAPTIQGVSNSGPIGEGSRATITLDATDPGLDPLSYEFDCNGDGDYGDAGDVGAQPANTADCTFGVRGSHTVNVRVSDGEGGKSTASTEVTVTNVAPTISDISNQTVDEDTATSDIPFNVGDAGTAAGDLTVSGSSSNTTLVPDSNIVFGGTGANRTVKVTPAANQSGTATITVSVSDGTAAASDTFLLTASAVIDAPTVTLIGEGQVAEGRSKIYEFTVVDPDAGDAFTVRSGFPDCGTEGVVASGSLTTSATGGSFRCRFLDGPATSSVRIQVDDAHSATSNIATKNTQVDNVAPLMRLTGSATADEGQGKAYTYTVTDPGDDTHTTQTGCGTKGVKIAGSETYDPATGNGAFRCHFPDGPATSGVSARVTDSDGASDSDNQLVEVQVANVAPTVLLSGPTTASEGETKTYTYAVSDPGDDPNPAITESCGANATKIDTPAADSFECTFGRGPASSTISVSANDGDHTGTASVVVNVSNVAPTISNIAGQTIDEDTATSDIPFNVGDAGTAAGDLTVSGSSSNTTLVPDSNIVFGGTGANRTVKVTPAANQSGTATITVSVSDGTAAASDTFLLTVRAVDTVAPRVLGVTPSHLASGVAPTANVTATFSEAMGANTLRNPNTLRSGTFTLFRKNADGTTSRVAAKVSYSAVTKKATLNPDSDLMRGATYLATMTTRAKDLAGNPLAAGKVWEFGVR